MIRKKILVLASTFPRWENDTTPPFVFELEKRLAEDFDITVLAPHFPGAKKKEIVKKMHIYRFTYFWPTQYQRLCYEGGILPNLKRNKLLYFQALSLLIFEFINAIRLIKKEKMQLIHAHWIIPQGFVALLLNKTFHIPYLVTTHGGDIYGLQNKLLYFVKKTVLQNAKKITVVSNAIKEEIIHTIDPRLSIEVLSMGVDSQLFNPSKFDRAIKLKYKVSGPLLLFVGRLAEKKGVRYLLEAMPAIIKEFPNIVLLIVGEGTIKDELEGLAIFLGISKNVFFVGGIPNTELPKYYATADIFIGPSIQIDDGDTEGLGLTFVEASFSGCIPVGTNIGGISDVIENNKSGILVPQKDPQSIADTVVKLLHDKKLARNLKSYGSKNLVKKFDWKYITQHYSQIYSLK